MKLTQFFIKIFLIVAITSSGTKLAAQQKSQTTKPNKTITSVSKSSVEINTSAACFDYLPLKDGAMFRYMEMTNEKGKQGSKVYSVEKKYHAAKRRVIEGVNCVAFISYETKKPIQVSKQEKLFDGLLGMKDVFTQNERIYYACKPQFKGALLELRERYQTDANLIGTYVEVEVETRGAAVYETGNSRTIGEYNYDRYGTGQFNVRTIVATALEKDEYIWRDNETRSFSTLLNVDLIKKEKSFFRVLNSDTTLTVLGKTYNNVFYCQDSIFEKGEPNAIYHYYYAKGVGLIRSVHTQLSSDMQYFMQKNQLTTTRELIPAEVKTDEDVKEIINKEINRKEKQELDERMEENRKIIEEANKRFAGIIDQSIVGEWVYDVKSQQQFAIFRFHTDGTGQSYRGAKNDKPYEFTSFKWRVEQGFWSSLVIKWLDKDGKQHGELERLTLEKKYLRSSNRKLGLGIIYYNYSGTVK